MATFHEENSRLAPGLFELVPDSAQRIKNHARNARRGETRDAWSRQSGE
jgi:hypothetical protein